MQNKNIRAYGLIVKEGKIFVCNEIINNFHATKFPGGGLEDGENPNDALKREICEELQLKVEKTFLLHAPGSLLSPWNKKIYTPLYYYVKASGSPKVPKSETLTIDYLLPEEILKKQNIAEPEKKATKQLLKLKLI